MRSAVEGALLLHFEGQGSSPLLVQVPPPLHGASGGAMQSRRDVGIESTHITPHGATIIIVIIVDMTSITTTITRDIIVRSVGMTTFA